MAVEHARSDNGPYLVEYKTFRMATHFSGDPGTYVNRDELEEWRKKDPIDLCRKKILERGILSEAEDGGLREQVQAEVDSAVSAALAAPDPSVEDLFKEVYSGEGVIA